MANLDIGWQHCQIVGNDPRRVKCKYCFKEMSGGVARLKQHLACISGNVAPCPTVPMHVKEQMKEIVLGKKKESRELKIKKQRIQEELMSTSSGKGKSIADENIDDDSSNEDDNFQAAINESRQYEMERSFSGRRGESQSSLAGIRRTMSNIKDAGRSSIPGLGRSFSTRPFSASVGPIDPFLQKKSKKQPSIKAAMKGVKDVKKYLGRAISKFFYYNHIAFNAADSPYFHGMVDAIETASGSGAKPPTAKEIATTYLDLEKQELQTYIQSFEALWDEFGCTVMCDGWTTQNRRNIINFLIYCPMGTIFLKSIDATNHFKSGQYIFKLMDSIVEEIGEDRVVQVVTDNGANYKAAGQLLMQKRKHLYWTPCAAHCIDLMLEDIAKEGEIKTIILDAQKVTGFIYNHGWLLALIRQETQHGELIRPTITRFATHFLALQSIYEHQHDLRRMVNSISWIENISKLKLAKEKKMAAEIYKLIIGEEFWRQIVYAISIFDPLIRVLRMVDSDDKAEMGFLYDAMDRAKKSIKKNVGKGYKKWCQIVDRRWDKQLHQDLHAAGYFLNPKILYTKDFSSVLQARQGLRRVIERSVPDIEAQIEIDKEIERYRMKLGYFASLKVQRSIQSYTPGEWWSINGREDAPNLAKYAVRILSQTVSSSNCERNWTTFTLIHTRVRNKLKMEKLKKLVFCHYNMRLRERNISRKQNENPIIDLDYIFNDEDPLSEWTREREDGVLDDRDNEWLDIDLTEGSHAQQQTDDPNSSGSKSTSSTDAPPGEHIHTHTPVQNVGYDYTHMADITREHGHGSEPSSYLHPSQSFRDDDYHDSHARHSGFYDYSQPYEYSSGIESHEQQCDQYSTYDNLMTSLFSCGQDQLRQYYQHPNDDDDEQQPYIPPRSSSWF